MSKIHQTTILVIVCHSLIALGPLPKDFSIAGESLDIFGTSDNTLGIYGEEAVEASSNGEFPPSCWSHPHLRHRSLSPRPQKPTSRRAVGLKAVTTWLGTGILIFF